MGYFHVPYLISQDKAHIDFALPASIVEILPGIADAANAIVTANLAIVTGFEDIVEERRYWMINDFSRVLCDGTHVRRTGEIGSISLKRKNQGKNNERIEIHVALPESHKSQPNAQRLRLDCDREASHDLNRLLDKPGSEAG